MTHIETPATEQEPDTTGHTPLPWHYEYEGTYARKPRVYGSDGTLVAEIGNAQVDEQDRWEADAKLLVSALNYVENDWLVRLSASEQACYKWPEDSDAHRALRQAFIDGASLYAQPVAVADVRGATVKECAQIALCGTCQTRCGSEECLTAKRISGEIMALIEAPGNVLALQQQAGR